MKQVDEETIAVEVPYDGPPLTDEQKQFIEDQVTLGVLAACNRHWDNLFLRGDRDVAGPSPRGLLGGMTNGKTR